MNKTKTHVPVFTVCAYCPKCGELLKKYLQTKCTKCGWDIDWQKAGKKNE